MYMSSKTLTFHTPLNGSSSSPHRTPHDVKTLHILLIRTNEKVELLENELKALTETVSKLAGTSANHGSPKSKRRGGRTAVG